MNKSRAEAIARISPEELRQHEQAGGEVVALAQSMLARGCLPQMVAAALTKTGTHIMVELGMPKEEYMAIASAGFDASFEDISKSTERPS